VKLPRGWLKLCERNAGSKPTLSAAPYLVFTSIVPHLEFCCVPLASRSAQELDPLSEQLAASPVYARVECFPKPGRRENPETQRKFVNQHSSHGGLAHKNTRQLLPWQGPAFKMPFPEETPKSNKSQKGPKKGLDRAKARGATMHAYEADNSCSFADRAVGMRP
jgi:hypothetical protein